MEDQTVVTYRPHSRPVGNIVVPPTHPQTVYTCSYDSTLRCGDFEKGIFDEVSAAFLHQCAAVCVCVCCVCVCVLCVCMCVCVLLVSFSFIFNVVFTLSFYHLS